MFDSRPGSSDVFSTGYSSGGSMPSSSAFNLAFIILSTVILYIFILITAFEEIDNITSTAMRIFYSNFPSPFNLPDIKTISSNTSVFSSNYIMTWRCYRTEVSTIRWAGKNRTRKKQERNETDWNECWTFTTWPLWAPVPR